MPTTPPSTRPSAPITSASTSTMRCRYQRRTPTARAVPSSRVRWTTPEASVSAIPSSMTARTIRDGAEVRLPASAEAPRAPVRRSVVPPDQRTNSTNVSRRRVGRRCGTALSDVMARFVGAGLALDHELVAVARSTFPQQPEDHMPEHRAPIRSTSGLPGTSPLPRRSAAGRYGHHGPTVNTKHARSGIDAVHTAKRASEGWGCWRSPTLRVSRSEASGPYAFDLTGACALGLHLAFEEPPAATTIDRVHGNGSGGRPRLQGKEALASAHERWAAAHAHAAEIRPRRPPVAQRAP